MRIPHVAVPLRAEMPHFLRFTQRRRLSSAWLHPLSMARCFRHMVYLNRAAGRWVAQACCEPVLLSSLGPPSNSLVAPQYATPHSRLLRVCSSETCTYARLSCGPLPVSARLKRDVPIMCDIF